MKGKITKLAFGAFAFAAVALFSLIGAQAVPMASQPWTRNLVSNEVGVAKSDMQKWTADFVDGKVFPPVDKEHQMWFDGTNLCVKVNGIIRKYPVKVAEIMPQTYGFLVTQNNLSDGVVSNGMFYADIGNDTYSCPNNPRMPTIRYTHSITQTVDDATYVYKKFDVSEIVQETNGTHKVVKWNTLQQDEQTWKAYKTVSFTNGTVKVLWFYMQYTKGTALSESPIVSYMPQEHRANRFEGMSFLEIIGELLFPSAQAINIDVSGSGLSMTVKITTTITDETGNPKDIDLGEFDATYSGPFAYWGEGGVVNSEQETTWTREETIDDVVYNVTRTRNPSYYPQQTDFKKIGNWLDSSYPVSFTDHDVIYDEYGEILEITEVPVSTTITSSEIYQTCGTSIDAILNAWSTPEVVILSKEKCDDCEKGWHTYEDSTCVCTLCYYNRGHHMVDNEDDENDCKICDFPIGICKDNTFKVRGGGSSKCGGRKEGYSYHRGFYANPETEFVWPPAGQGSKVQCVCHCGYYGSQNQSPHDLDEDYDFIHAGDLWGNNRKEYHVKKYSCLRDTSSTVKCGGWWAKQEAHTVTGEQGTVSPCWIEYKQEGTQTTEVYHPIDAPTQYPFETDGEGHSADSVYHMVENGVCDDCGENVDGKVQHNFDGGCVCKDCGVQVHTWDESIYSQCPKAAYCKVCQKWFGRDDATGTIVFENVGGDHHTFALNFESDEDINQETHHCLCWKKAEQKHNWVETESGDNEQCSDPGPDDEQFDENGNQIRGCGLLKHNEENCPEDEAVGECGNWWCPVCGKTLTHDKNGNPAPSAHAPVIHSGDTEKCKHYGSATIKGVYHCAVCKHSFMGTTCGTDVDDKGEHVYVGTILYDKNLHSNYQPCKNYEGSDKNYHDCQCRRSDKNHTLGYHEGHNWGDKTAVVKYNPDGTPDKTYHSGVRYCNHKTDNKQDRDTCNYEDKADRQHVWVDVNPKLYTQDENGNCKRNVVCHETDGNGNVIGCNLTDKQDASHEWQWFPYVGQNDRWQCGTGDKIEKCFRGQICEHGPQNDSGTLTPQGCGKIRFEFAESGGHDKKYDSPSVFLNDEKHVVHVTCNRDCGYDALVTNKHAWVNKAMYWNNEQHRKYRVCEKEVEKDAPCYEEELQDYANHSQDKNKCVYENSIYHHQSNWCEKCSHEWYGKSIHHDGYFRQIYDLYNFIGVAQSWISHIGDPAGEHVRTNYCASCDNYYGNTEPCDYHSSEDWEMINDEDDQPTGDFDLATCELCHETVRLAHVYHALDSDYHACQHRTPSGWSPVHLFGEHQWGTVPGEGYWGCVICGYNPSFYYHCDDCDCCWRDNNTVHCLYGWNYDNERCGCRFCQKGEGSVCYCHLIDVTIDKLTNPAIIGMIGRYSGDPNITGVDGDDPVYMIGESGLRNAYMECPNLEFIKFNFVTNIGERGCECLGSNSSNLYNVGFRDLKTVGTKGFYEAFSGCASLESMSFPSLVEVGESGFQNAFYQTPITNVSFNSLKSVGDYGFSGTFMDYDITNFSFNAIEEIGNYAFDGAFKYEPDEEVTLDFSSVRKCGINGFPYSTTLLITNLTEISPRSFVSAFGNVYGTVDMRNVVKVGEEGLNDRLMTSSYVTNLILSSIKEIGTNGFQYALSAPSFERLDFSSLDKIDAYAFQDAGIRCDVDFGNVKTIYPYGLANALSPSSEIIVNLDSVEEVKDYGCFGMFSGSIGNSLSLPNCTVLGSHAFEGSSYLTDINIPNVVSMGSHVFMNCISLTNVPNDIASMSKIPDYTFYGCTGIEHVEADAEEIGDFAFGKAENVTKVILPYCNVIGESAFEVTDYSEADFMIGLIYAPNAVEIGRNAFYNRGRDSELREIEFESVTNVHAFAFANQINLKTMNTPNLKVVGGGAFTFCGIENLDLPSVEVIEDYAEREGYHAGAFEDCANLTNVVLANAKSIGAGAFESCGVMSVSLQSAERLGDFCFRNCGMLATVYMPSVRTLKNEEGGSCFENCTSLRRVFAPELIDVGDSAFYGCSVLDDIVMSNVVTIGSLAFSGCRALREVYMPNVVSIGGYAFRDCTNLVKSLTFAKCASVGQYAFNGLQLDEFASNAESFNLSWDKMDCKRISLPNAKSVSGTAKQSDSSSVSSNVKEFIAPNLTKVSGGIPISVTNFVCGVLTNVGNFSFAYCDKINDIGRVDQIEYLGESALMLTGITNGDFRAVKSIGANALRKTKIKRAECDVCTDVGRWAFSYNTELEYVSLTNAVNIWYDGGAGTHTFDGCTNLKEAYLPNANSDLDYAFKDCTSLERADVGNKKVYGTTVRASTFVGCTSLRELHARAIENNALSNLPSISEVFLNEIGDYNWCKIQYVVDHGYFGARSGCLFHCYDGDVAVP